MRRPTPRTIALAMLAFQLAQLVLWSVMTALCQLHVVKASIAYLTFVSNWALVAAAFAGVAAALAALWAESS